MKYTLRQLEIFLAIAQAENISRAAEKLSMSQSAASAALQQLEQRQDASLFDRVGKSLQLNKVGQSLRPKAEALVAHAREFQRDLDGHADQGHLNVGASQTIGNYLAVGYLARYLSEHPQARTNFQVASTPDIVTQVLNHELDIGLVEGEVQHKELDLIAWRDDRLQVFCGAGHPLAKRKILQDADLLRARWILREADSGARRTFERAMHGLLPGINVYLELTHNEAIKRAVETGIGVGCLSEIALESGFRSGGLIPLRLPKREMRRTFYFVLRKDRYPSKAVEWWMELCTRK